MSFVAPAISAAEPVIAKLVAVAGDTVTLKGVEVVIPLAVAEIDLGCDWLELYNTIGILLATPSVNVTLVDDPKFVLLTIGLLLPIALAPLKVNDLLPV